MAGVVAVPAGVLDDTRLLVCFGAACLFASLALLAARAFAGHATPAAARGRFELGVHALLLIVIAVSTGVGVGVALAWSQPWL